MSDSKESKKEKSRIKKNEIKNDDLQRNDEKKPTLNLSECPNLINDVTQYYGKPENGVSSIFTDGQCSLLPGLLYPSKIKDSFINEPISHTKEESRSSMEELQDLFRETTGNESENKSKSISKKDKRQKMHSKRKNSSIEKLGKNKNKEKDNNDKNIEEIKIKKKNNSHWKIKDNNDLDDDQKTEKNKKCKIKFRKSEIIRPFKKYDIFSGDENKKKIKRKSLFSQQTISPDKILNNDFFNKFLEKKEEKEEKRNEDKIYINIDNKEEIITVKTAQKTVKNYYEYMQDCFQLIEKYYNKTIKLPSIEPINFHFKEDKKIIVFELENTLISCFEDNLPNEMNKTIGINVRPHLKSSLDLIKNDYNIVIYSSSDKFYVDKILDFLDPEHKFFNYRLYKEHCYKFNINDKIYYTKNLNIFKNICSLKDIIIVDCSVLGFGFFLDNGIPIIPFYDSKEDVELRLLSYYLLSISSNYDLRQALKRDMKLNDYLEDAKKENEKKEIILDKNEEKENKKNKKIKDFHDKNYKSTNASPAGNKKRSKKNCQTCRDKNLPFIPLFKGSSDSEEDKKSPDNKTKTKKHKKEHDKYSPKKENRYYSTKVLKVLKRKNRKFTVSDLNRNDMEIKSPKKTSPGKIGRHSAKKVNDKNKKFINEG